jgi:hypothetical protein
MRNPNWDVSPGEIVSVTYAETTAALTGTAQFPLDNTIPQISEGTEILATASITPKKIGNNFLIRYKLHISSSVSNYGIAALFEGTTADAIDVTQKLIIFATYAYPNLIVGEIVVPITSLAARVYSIRIGPDTTNQGTLYVNTVNGTAYFGGKKRSILTVTEIAG